MKISQTLVIYGSDMWFGAGEEKALERPDSSSVEREAIIKNHRIKEGTEF